MLIKNIAYNSSYSITDKKTTTKNICIIAMCIKFFLLNIYIFLKNIHKLYNKMKLSTLNAIFCFIS